MDEESQMGPTSIEDPKRRLGWIDLSFILVGIVIMYVLLTLGTVLIMKHWPYEQILLYASAFMTQLSFVFLLWVLKRKRSWEWTVFGWKTISMKKIFPIVFKFYGLIWVFNIVYAIILYQNGLTPPETDVYTKLLEQSTWYVVILNIILAGILAPLVEETLFRGVIFGSLQAYFGKWTSAVLSSIIFSGLHFQLYGLVPRFILGMALVYLYDKYKSLYPSIVLHAVNNIVAILLSAVLFI